MYTMRTTSSHPPITQVVGSFALTPAGLAAVFAGAFVLAVLLLAAVPLTTPGFLLALDALGDCFVAVDEADGPALLATGVARCFCWFSAIFCTPCLAFCIANVDRGRVMAVSTGVIGSVLRTFGAGFGDAVCEARMIRRLVSSCALSIVFFSLGSRFRPAVGFSVSGRGCFFMASSISFWVLAAFLVIFSTADPLIG